MLAWARTPDVHGVIGTDGTRGNLVLQLDPVPPSRQIVTLVLGRLCPFCGNLRRGGRWDT